MKRYSPTLEAASWASLDDHDTDVHAVMAEDQRGDWVRIEEANPATMYPTLHDIGLGPQLAELERLFREGKAGKMDGVGIPGIDHVHHLLEAYERLELDLGLDDAGEPQERDPDSGALHLVHAAARLLMAAACVEREGEVNG